MLANAPGENAAVGPILVQSKDCVFLNPFAGSPPAGLFRAQANALGRGLLLWRADGDAFDKRLHYVVTSAGTLPPKTQPQPQTEWERLWGSPGTHALTLDLELTPPPLDAIEWSWTLVEKLAVPPIKATGLKDRPVGAKLADLPLPKKPKRP